jgi:hypothetical protein
MEEELEENISHLTYIYQFIPAVYKIGIYTAVC